MHIINGKTYGTYYEWKTLGRHVLRGEKSKIVDETTLESLFSEEQTQLLHMSYRDYEDPDYDDWFIWHDISQQ